MKQIIANIVCALAYSIMLWYTFKNTKRQTILICNLIISILFGVQYLLLDAYVGSIVSFFGIIMYTLYSFKGKNKFLSSLFSPLLCATGYITLSIITWNDALDILPLTCGILSVVSMWIGKEFWIKTTNIPISIMWIIYNVIYLAYVGIVGQSLLLIMDFVYLYMYFKKYRYINNENKNGSLNK